MIIITDIALFALYTSKFLIIISFAIFLSLFFSHIHSIHNLFHNTESVARMHTIYSFLIIEAISLLYSLSIFLRFFPLNSTFHRKFVRCCYCWCVDCCGSTTTESDRFVSRISKWYSWFLVYLIVFFFISFYLSVFRLSFTLTVLLFQFSFTFFLLLFLFFNIIIIIINIFFTALLAWVCMCVCFFCYLYFCLLPVIFFFSFFLLSFLAYHTKQWHWLNVRVWIVCAC